LQINIAPGTVVVVVVDALVGLGLGRVVGGLVVGGAIGVVGLGMHGVVAGGIVLQACTISLSRMAASPLKSSTKK